MVDEPLVQPSAGLIDVLIVEDRPVARRLLEAELKRAPELHICGEARDGQEAVALARQLEPDIIIMDIVMPRMDGLAATREIRTFSDVPIILLSGSQGGGDTLQYLAKKRGANAFFVKPSGPVSADLYRIRDELIAEIRRLVSFG